MRRGDHLSEAETAGTVGETTSFPYDRNACARRIASLMMSRDGLERAEQSNDQSVLLIHRSRKLLQLPSTKGVGQPCPRLGFPDFVWILESFIQTSLAHFWLELNAMGRLIIVLRQRAIGTKSANKFCEVSVHYPFRLVIPLPMKGFGSQTCLHSKRSRKHFMSLAIARLSTKIVPRGVV
jgi:hypothetical protein